ncbi:MBL fold metallo-hydrolase [Promicromonospora sp. CA-289599]|uniref:MBL fold metallo-hydrolase n=1 Tax=Promicromonospora sp. CA-289599 TaxID=3240014 RepID=UPI003D8D87B0
MRPSALSGARWAQPAVRRSLTLGEITATYLPDGYVELHPARWFSLDETTDLYDDRPELVAASGYLVASIGVLLLEGPGWRILVDAGLGPTSVPADATHPALGVMRGGGLASFAQVIGEVDAVVLTHAHDDHVGWARRGWPGLPGVARAPHLVGRDEPAPRGWEHVDDGQQIVPGVTAIATPGHTAGHLSLVVAGEDRRLVVLGDTFHSSLQVEVPRLSSCFDVDPARSRDSRARMLRELDTPGTVAVATHFADVPFGRVRAGRWEPVA